MVEEEAKESNKAEAEKVEKPSSPIWLCLLVRSNRKHELMLLASGKYLTKAVIDGLRDFFSEGPGKDCNVKSLYCKTCAK